VYNHIMSTNDLPLLTVDELAASAGVPVRTVRFYIAEGLLPGASARGKGASYTQEHLDRLQLIRLLVARHLPLAEIRALLGRLPSAEVRAVVEEEQARTGEVAVQASKPSPKEYLSALLEQARGYPMHRPAEKAERSRDADSQVGHRPESPVPATSAPRASAPQHEPALPWHRWELAPGIELQVRADVARTEPAVIERVLNALRAALPEGPAGSAGKQLSQEGDQNA
jgi:DNA-binding transcriptional MerR regulator